MAMANPFTDTRAGAALEMGIVFPFFLVLTTGIVDLSTMLMTATAVSTAVQAGAAYLIMHPGDAVTGGTGAAAAMNSATALTIQAVPAPTLVNGVLTVTATASYAPILPWPGMSTALSSTITMRME
jgi:Flp pilus assembly protein TadG